MESAADFLWDDEEFDDDFFREVDKLEELANSLATQRQNQNQNPPPPNPPPPPEPPQLPPQPQPQPFVAGTGGTFANVSYSPPRELSQRFPHRNDSNSSNPSSSNNARFAQSPVTQEQLEIERLKVCGWFQSELSIASKQLSDLKQECFELRKERDKNKQLKSVHPNREASTWNSEVLIQDQFRCGISHKCEKAAGHATPQICVEQKNIGIQTEKDEESASASTSGATSTHYGNRELLSIWSRGNCYGSERSFVAKLLETCSTDFCFLFRCFNPNMTSTFEIEKLNFVAFPRNVQGLQPGEVARASQLYSVMIKLTNDETDVNALVDALLDLCSLDSALVVHRSLHILHVALDNLLSMDRFRPKRDNIKVESCLPGSDAVHNDGSAVRKSIGINDISKLDTTGSYYNSACKSMGNVKHESTPLLGNVDLFHVYESMCQITVRLTEEHARTEAVSIMNVILMTTDAYSGREKFGSVLVFEAVALLLRKEAGLSLRKEATDLLFLLLNCPNILSTFCSSIKGAGDHVEPSTQEAKNPSFQASCGILEGLANCIVGCERGVKGLILCRNAIILLAFLAASGKLGLEIFLFHKLSKGTNFLGLILQVLVAAAESYAVESCPEPEISKERTLLVREALILLNRLASHQVYSTSVMQVLTSSRDMVSLAIEVATRLSKKSKRLLKSDNVTRQMRESEVVDLARVFRKRVFSFLGANSSS